jgi:hypothetical protein
MKRLIITQSGRVKDAISLSTTMDIYAQIVPVSQRRALEQLAEFAKEATPDARSNSRSSTVQ